MIDTHANLTGGQVRELCRLGEFTGPTCGAALGYTQANLVVLPAKLAPHFEWFCQLNQKPCPLLEVTTPGQFEPTLSAPGADLRTDLPRYRVCRDGQCIDTPTSISGIWREDFVAFLIGCSFTFESALLRAFLPVRHLEQACNVPMYRTNIECESAGPFGGPTVVSMRPMTPEQAGEASRVTAAHEKVHGSPIHIGDPQAIGISHIDRPDYGDAVEIRKDEVPVFWACGVTPLEAIARAKPEIAVTHEPGHMFVTDLLDNQLRLKRQS